MRIRGLTVCVGYDDLLAITLPLNMRHLAECLVVTSPDDERTMAVVSGIPGAMLHVTDAFTRPDANGVVPYFNKGLAAEEALDAMGRDGWICSWDADTIMPDSMPLDRVRTGCIHGLHRRILDDVRSYSGARSWRMSRTHRDDPAVGYFQLFHADDPAVKGRRPWFDPTFAHAGGCDEYLAAHWPDDRRLMLPATCLHLGPVATNWYGRVSVRTDGRPVDGADRLPLMDGLIKRFDWHWARPGLSMGAMVDDGTAPHRLDLTGLGPSGFEVPFADKDRPRPRRTVLGWRQALEIVVARTRHERFRFLCSDDNHDAASRQGYRAQVVKIAESGLKAESPPTAEDLALRADLERFGCGGCGGGVTS